MISTLSWNDDLRSTKPELADLLLRDVIRPNVRTLRRHRVPIVVGSDQFRETPRGELRVLARLGLFSNAEIVRMATTDTSRFIFPKRKIGRLAEGFEAHFLVLDGNPAAHLENLATILLRVKSGRILP